MVKKNIDSNSSESGETTANDALSDASTETPNTEASDTQTPHVAPEGPFAGAGSGEAVSDAPSTDETSPVESPSAEAAGAETSSAKTDDVQSPSDAGHPAAAEVSDTTEAADTAAAADSADAADATEAPDADAAAATEAQDAAVTAGTTDTDGSGSGAAEAAASAPATAGGDDASSASSSASGSSATAAESATSGSKREAVGGAETPAAASAPTAAPEAAPVPFVSAPSTLLIFQAPPVLPQVADDRDDDRGWRDRSGSSRDERRSRDDDRRSRDQGGRNASDRTDRYSRDDRDRDRDDRDDRSRDDRAREDRARDDRDDDTESSSARRRNRRRSGEEDRSSGTEPANTVVKVRQPREPELITEPQRIKGSTRLEAKKQRRRDGRDAGRRRTVVTEAEFLARRESVDRKMVVRSKHSRIQIGVLEDGVLVEHYVARNQDASLIGNVYLGRVQNVLPSMEAAFVDIGRGRNAVLYSGEVDWDAAETGNQPRRIELALKPGDRVLVQVTKDPVGHKGARLTSQVSLPGRYLVYVPNGSMNGISRKLPDTERARLKKILKEVLPDNNGVIVRTAAEGATEEQLTLDVNRLINQWAEISRQVESVQAPALLHSEPDLLIKIVRDVFNEDFQKMVIDGDDAREVIESYLRGVAPDLLERVERYEGQKDSFDEYRISEQIEKALDRKVWLPSGGSLVIDRTEAMTVIDVNTGKFVGSGGNLEETVTKNNLEAAEEIVRQLRLRDIGGIIVVDFIDMVLENNRDLVLRRMVECLSRDRTKHQVAEVTSLGLVQMTRKKLGLGLLESFSEPCETCAGRGVIVHHEPVFKHRQQQQTPQPERRRGGKGQNGNGNGNNGSSNNNNNGGNGNNNGGGNNGGNGGNGNGQNALSQAAKAAHAITDDAKNALAQIAASTLAAHPSGDEAAQAEHDAQASANGAAEASTDSNGDTSRRDARQGGQQAGNGQQNGQQQNGSGETASESPRKKRSRNKRDKQQNDRAPRDARGAETSTPDASAQTESAAAPVERSAAPVEAPATEASNPPREAAPERQAEPARILDLPIVANKVERPARRNADDLLGSVLDALPEPKQPGQGRSKSRRVTTAALQGTPVRHEPTPVKRAEDAQDN
jgi:ribonuclease E